MLCPPHTRRKRCRQEPVTNIVAEFNPADVKRDGCQNPALHDFYSHLSQQLFASGLSVNPARDFGRVSSMRVMQKLRSALPALPGSATA